MIFIPIFTAIGLGLFFLIADGLCSGAVKKSYKRLETYHHKEIQLDGLNVTYVDRGKGEAILSVHGICGGYDQGFDTAGHLARRFRVIAPSRFGYLGSDLPGDPGPKEQAKVFASLLDALDIDKVYLLGASAGGTVAIRFALDYPDRVKGLILYSTAAPLIEKPKHYTKYEGPPAFLCNNYGMWLASLFFKQTMSFKRETIYTMLPITDRRDGIINDASVTNPDMARNFDEYTIENLQSPVIIFQAKNDKMAKYKLITKSLHRFKNHTFVVFDTGGHMLDGRGKEIDEELETFFPRANE